MYEYVKLKRRIRGKFSRSGDEMKFNRDQKFNREENPILRL